MRDGAALYCKSEKIAFCRENGEEVKERLLYYHTETLIVNLIALQYLSTTGVVVLL
jgi:hypothetical protein